MQNKERDLLKVIFPKGIFEWFDIKSWEKKEEDICVVFEEKNIPPLEEKDKSKKIIPKGFTDITITDFPIRGKRSLLTFKRRYWQIEGEKGYLKRDVKITFPGTQLEKEFADFLKEDGGRGTILAGFYRKVSKDPDKRI
jgi:hypothetical protein